jgi:outer membrane protein
LKHLIRLILPVFLLIIGTSVAFASEATDSASSPKIGVLDWNLLLNKAPQAELAGQRLEKEFQVRKDKLTNKQKDFLAKQEKIQRDKDVLSDAERSKTEKELTKLQQDLRHMDEELRADYTARHREEMDEFIKIVREVVDKLAQDEKYDLVLSQEATLFMADRVDITDKVIQRLSKKPGTSSKSVKSDAPKDTAQEQSAKPDNKEVKK